MYWFHDAAVMHEMTKHTYSELHLFSTGAAYYQTRNEYVLLKCLIPSALMEYVKLAPDQKVELFEELVRELIDLKKEQRLKWLKIFLPWYDRKSMILHEKLTKLHIPHQLVHLKDPWTSIAYHGVNWDHLPVDQYDVYVNRVKPDFEQPRLDVLMMTQMDFDDDATESETKHLKWIHDHQDTKPMLKTFIQALLETHEEWSCELVHAGVSYWHG